MAPLLDTPLIAYPTLTEAARLLAVSASTLSRRDDLRAERMGERDRRVPADEVMRLAALYRRRSLNEVAADVVDYAAQHAPKQATAVEGQIEAFFAEHQAQALAKGASWTRRARPFPTSSTARWSACIRPAARLRPPWSARTDRILSQVRWRAVPAISRYCGQPGRVERSTEPRAVDVRPPEVAWFEPLVHEVAEGHRM
jgi:hypothetical protein